jgi:hypothetical protein
MAPERLSRLQHRILRWLRAEERRTHIREVDLQAFIHAHLLNGIKE